MKIRKGDKVKVMKGKDAGKVGVVLRVLPDVNKVMVEGVNIVKKHVKPGTVSKEGGVIKKEAPVQVSNVRYFDGEIYEWYVVVDDGYLNRTSDTWTLKVKINSKPTDNMPIYIIAGSSIALILIIRSRKRRL